MPKSKAKKGSVDTAAVAEAAVVYGVPRSLSTKGSSTFDKPPLDVQTSSEPNLPAEPSLGERLQKDLGVTSEVVEHGPPKADSLAILLEQGLKSNDASLLQTVLSRNDEKLIRKTVELLPLQYVIPLIQYLGKMCSEERPKPNKAPLVWLSLTLTIRSSYLTTLPNLSEILRDIYVHGDRRTKNLDKFVRLAGTVNASVNLAKQRIAQKNAAMHSQSSGVNTYDEPLDESEGDEDDAGDTDDEEAATEEEDGEGSDDEDTEDELKHKKSTTAFTASSDEEGDGDRRRKVNGKRAQRMEVDDDESE